MVKIQKNTDSNLKERKETQEQRGVAIPIEKLPGVYANVALIHHTRNEFVLDFILDIAGQANFVSRIITSPEHIKRLNNVLNQNIKKYEENFGEIIIPK